ncbi:hypothetical protein [Ruminococcus flavefaciens]|uniref:hypothetical protein n=1 Tax=Ruminococcus flavefaciens TaxID=1265 RepID=UPI0004668DB2|nr:hypothetical protein [Ruminococcus flavefaciens]
MLKITDDLMKQCLDGFELEYELPVLCTVSVIDSFFSTGRDYHSAFAAISKYRTLLLVPLKMSVYLDGTVYLLEYPLLRFEYCKVTKTIFGNYSIKAKITDSEQKSIFMKLNLSRKILGADLTMQSSNIDEFAEILNTWGNSGFFKHKK